MLRTDKAGDEGEEKVGKPNLESEDGRNIFQGTSAGADGNRSVLLVG